MGLSLAYITPGCVPAIATMLTMYAFSIHLVLLSTAIPTCALPCVPLHSTVINLKSRGYPELLGLLLAYNAWVRSGFSEESYGCLSIAASGSRNYAYAIRYFAVRPAPTRLRKIYCRQFPNSVRISTAEQISYEMKGAIAPLAPHKYGNGKTYSTLI